MPVSSELLAQFVWCNYFCSNFSIPGGSCTIEEIKQIFVQESDQCVSDNRCDDVNSYSYHLKSSLLDSLYVVIIYINISLVCQGFFDLFCNKCLFTLIIVRITNEYTICYIHIINRKLKNNEKSKYDFASPLGNVRRFRFISPAYIKWFFHQRYVH